MMVIVPNHVRDVINAKLDAALAECPEAAVDREIFYRSLLEYFDENGELPDLKLVKGGQKDLTQGAS